MWADRFGESGESRASAHDLDREPRSMRPAIPEGLAMKGRRDPELQEQTTHILGQSTRRGRVEDRPAAGMDAAVPLKQLRHQNRDGLAVPGIHERRDALVQRSLTAKPARLEEEAHRPARLAAIPPRGAHGSGPPSLALLDPRDLVRNRLEDARHVGPLVRPARVDVEVALVAEAAFG